MARPDAEKLRPWHPGGVLLWLAQRSRSLAPATARMALGGAGLRATPPLLLASLNVAPLAQLAEQLTLNQRVRGSSP